MNKTMRHLPNLSLFRRAVLAVSFVGLGGCAGTSAKEVGEDAGFRTHLDAAADVTPSADARATHKDGGPADGASEEAASDSGPVNVPMTITKTSSGTERFAVSVQIGDAPPLDVQLDTGSSGLRIEQGAVPASSFASTTTTPVTYSYHSGLVITGVVAYATVAIGGLATPKPIPVMLIEQVGCESSMPNCGAAGKTPQNYTLFGPYKAILGVGMRNGSSAIGSPIPQLPNQPAFVVEAPDYGGTSGTVVLYPPPSQVARFATFQLPAVDGGVALANGTPAWNDRFGVPACVDDQTSGVDYCLPSEWDTGNPPTYIEWPGDTDGGTSVLPGGSEVKVTIGPASAPLGSYSFTVGTVPTPGIDEVLVEPATESGFMNVGTALFFHYDALFDQRTGLVGLAAHE